MADKHTLAFEIGVEEIPAFDLDSANKQLEKMVPAAFADARIPFDSIEIHSSPRRLIVMAYGVADATEALVEEYKGPAAKIAFDADGNPTKAAIGFARGKGLDPENLERREVNGTEYVFATKNIPATPVADLLPEVLTGFITAIKWPRSCRWAAYREYFVRPVRWIVAMLNDVVLPVSFAGAASDNFTMGHRVLAPGKHTVDTAANLLNVVRAAYVIPTQAERERIIREGVAAIEAETGFTADLPAKTLLEVVNLSEYPQPLVSTFDEEFLQVPEEIIVDAMLMHQRYFPLYDAAGKLTNKFIIVSNGNPECAATIIDGNERVVRARLDDAKFFYEEDLKHPLESYIEKLDKVVFQESLGTVRQKAERLEKLAGALSADAQLSAADAARRRSAPRACARPTWSPTPSSSSPASRASWAATTPPPPGKRPQVAQRHRPSITSPRFAGDALPDTDGGPAWSPWPTSSTPSAACSPVGQGPTGSSDPFALRRSAIGIVNHARGGPAHRRSLAAVDESLASYAAPGRRLRPRAAVRAEVADFFVTRTKVMLRDAGRHRRRHRRRAGRGRGGACWSSAQRARALEAARAKRCAKRSTTWPRPTPARTTCASPKLGEDVDDSLLTDPERALASARGQPPSRRVAAALVVRRLRGRAVPGCAALRAPIDGFFADVMVMDEDAALRDNRLRLLNRFVAVFANVADFGRSWRNRSRATVAGFSQTAERLVRCEAPTHLACFARRRKLAYRSTLRLPPAGGRSGTAAASPLTLQGTSLEGGRDARRVRRHTRTPRPLPTIHVVSDSVGLDGTGGGPCRRRPVRRHEPQHRGAAPCALVRGGQAASSPSTARLHQPPVRRRAPARLLHAGRRRPAPSRCADYCESASTTWWRSTS